MTKEGTTQPPVAGSRGIRTGVATAAALLSVSAFALEIDTGNQDLAVRWDTTVKYSYAQRLNGQMSQLTGAANANLDDGDMNFSKGSTISNRVDLFTEMDAVFKKDMGFRMSAAAWYDAAYMQSNNNPGLAGGAFPNQTSVPYNQFTKDTQGVHGSNSELLDAFVFGKFDLGGSDTTVRAGRHSILWGESVFFGANAIAGGQMPVDVVKLTSVPGTQFKEAILPVPMLSGQVQLNSIITFGAYLQTASSQSRVPAAGSYFSTADMAVQGGETLLLAPGAPFPPAATRLPDQAAKDSGQGGIELKIRGEETDWGLYAIQFHEKTPQLVPVLGMVANPGPGPATIGPMPVGYRLVYQENITALGMSASKTFGDYNVATEVSFRDGQDLASTQGVDTSLLGGPATNNNSNPAYALGQTGHVNVSVLGSLPKTFLWNEATLIAEAAFNRVLAITKNPAAADPNATRDGLAYRMVLEPTYRQVATGLDIGVPLGIGYAPAGYRPMAISNPSAWLPEDGGDISIGINGVYLDKWRFTLNMTHYFGHAQPFTVGTNNAYSYGQSLADRDFVSASLRYSF